MASGNVASMWGRLITCAAVDYRRRAVANAEVGRLTIGRSLPSCPTTSQAVCNTVILTSRYWRLPRVLMAVAGLGVPLRAQGEQRYEGVAMKNVMVAMRDGVKLSTDIYRPAVNGVAVEGKFPVLLERTPYGKGPAANAAAYFVPRGYVVIIQDVRGRYQSEGRWRPIVDDPNDGHDTAAWIGAQSWSDGGIGTMGSSYGGATQHALAIGNAPYVKAMVPRNAMSDFGRYGVRHNVTSLPLRPGTTPLKFAPDYEAWLIEAMSHGDYDNFWKDSGSSVVDHLAEYKDVPEYHTTGWYDSWGTSVANLNFVELRKAKKSLQRLIVGPWIHSSETIGYAGEAQFTADAALDLQAFHLRWFDHWLKGVDNGVDREPPVRIYVMGGGDAHKTPEGRLFVGGHWRDEREWPLARALATPYYLHPNGVLSPDKPADGPPTTYLFDPRNPVPTLGGNCLLYTSP